MYMHMHMDNITYDACEIFPSFYTLVPRVPLFLKVKTEQITKAMCWDVDKKLNNFHQSAILA